MKALTALDVYNGVLIELNKANAPSYGEEEFNYFFNKTIINYISTQAGLYDLTQEISDNLRVLFKSNRVDYDELSTNPNWIRVLSGINTQYHIKATANDYFRMLGGRICYVTNGSVNEPDGTPYVFNLRRESQVTRNNTSGNAYTGPHPTKARFRAIGNWDRKLVDANNNPIIEVDNPLIELTIGDMTKFSYLVPVYVEFDYLKLPEKVVLTEDQIYNSLTDTSQVLQFPYSSSNELIKIMSDLILENQGDPRLQTKLGIQTAITTKAPVNPSAVQI